MTPVDMFSQPKPTQSTDKKIVGFATLPILHVGPSQRITEANDGPRCSRDQIRNFRENWEKHVPPRVVRQLKKSGDVMHGAYSVNMQMPSRFHRKTNDIDVYSRQPYQRAREIENQLDRCAGCDIAHVKTESFQVDPDKPMSVEPPKFSELRKQKEESPDRAVVITAQRYEDVDYATFPPDRRIASKVVNGVRHETLEEAYIRAHAIKNKPMRSARAYADINRIEAYWKSIGRKPWEIKGRKKVKP